MIKIVTLGKLEVVINNIDVTSSFKQSHKLLLLLNIFISSRETPVSTGNICDVIWGDYAADNAHKSLHNLIYRLRDIFAKNGEPECIIYSNKTYMLNPDCNWSIDAYTIEQDMFEAQKPGIDESEKINRLKNIVKLYNGPYIFYTICEDSRSLYLSGHYKRIYSNAVCMLSDIYLMRDEFSEALKLCDIATLLAHFDDQIILRKVRALQGQNKDKQALDVLVELFSYYRETGMQAPEILANIYSTLRNRETLS